MALPVTIPNTFANATSSIPLSQLDANFSTLANAVNGINSGAETLANLKASNVTITGGIISNVTLDNVTVSVETLANVTITDSLIVTANTASDAVRITQIGTGNALVVEDSTNPDSTPFVVSNDGRVVIGHTTPLAVGGTQLLQLLSTASVQGLIGRYSNDTGCGALKFVKSRSTTIGGNTIVSNGDSIGIFEYQASDGTSPILAASILCAVDGTPGTSDMPGRLVFSTTADGASSPTERMRIDSSGQVTIGGTATAGQNVRVAKNITGSTTGRGVLVTSTVQSDVTSVAYGYSTFLGTQATSFTLVSLSHYHAQQGTIGATSTATNQYGFTADSSLTGATNNYGFYSNIASGTGRWNFYSAGTAASYFGGDVQFKKAIVEEVYTITDGAAFEIDPSNGTMQLITLGASRTPKATNFAAGESITLMVNDGSAYTITWTDATWGGSGVVWLTNSGTAPTLATTGYTTIVLWKVGSQVYGARVGDNA